MTKSFDLNLLYPLIEEAVDYPTNHEKPSGRTGNVSFGITLFGIVISLKAQNVLELGIGGGGSSYPLLLGCHLTGGKLTSVDNGTFPLATSWVNNTSIKNLSDSWNVVIKDAPTYLESQADPIDLVFIDDWHEHDHVLRELELVKDLLTPSALIIMHDAMYGNWEPRYHEDNTPGGEFGGGGVYGAIKTFVGKYPGEFEFCTLPVDHGFTILRKIIK